MSIRTLDCESRGIREFRSIATGPRTRVNLLELKLFVVNSPIEGVARTIRDSSELIWRLKHPEATELALEGGRLPLVLKKLLPGNANCVDVGCHIGSFLSLLLKLFPAGQHSAVEASPAKGARLTAKFQGIPIHNVAVSDALGRATFEENPKRPGFSRLLGNNERSQSNSYIDVDVTTLDRLLADHSRIDLIKLDIEGAECAALRGASDILEKHRPMLLFEVGADDGLEPGYRRALFDLLTTNLSYEIFTFTDVLFNKGPVQFDEFRKCGVWPFRAFNFIAKPR